MPTRKLISFDWAMKKLLRSKVNFEILEGFLSELLREDVRILEILDSESNKETRPDKFNRVDLKVRNDRADLGGGSGAGGEIGGVYERFRQKEQERKAVPFSTRIVLGCGCCNA